MFFFVGLIAALIGVGGGVFFVPILLAMGYPPDVAVGTSSIAVAFTTTIGGIGYYREGFYDKRITLKVLLFAYPGVILGVLLSVNVPATVRPAIGLMLIIAGYRAFRKFMVPQRLQIPGFFLAGLAIGLLGIGGGVILTPLIVSTSPYDLIYSIGIAYTTKPLLTIPSAILHLMYGKADVHMGVRIGIFSSLGSYTGSKIAGRFKENVWFKRAIGALMISTGAYIIVRAFVRERYNRNQS